VLDVDESVVLIESSRTRVASERIKPETATRLRLGPSEQLRADSSAEEIDMHMKVRNGRS
jgi:hypothetical protein